ncbi:MAG: hypothetical protein V4471_00710 [Pseudomonadota bacterium]
MSEDFVITEEEPILSENGTYFIGENTDFFFSIKNRFAYVASVSLDTKFPEEIKLHNRGSIGKNSTSEIKVSLEPSSTGEKSFKILVKNNKNKSKTLEKKFNVELKSTLVEAKIDKQLPASMKLGQKSGVIFLFTNRGSQPVTDISIEIKQTEVTS